MAAVRPIGDRAVARADTAESSIDFRRLYHDLCGDDEPATLLLAEQSLQRRLLQLAGAAGDGLPGIMSAPSVETAPLPAAALVWLRTEPLVLQRVAQAATSDDATCLRLYEDFRRWRARSGLERTPDPGGLNANDVRWEAAVIRRALANAPGLRLPELLGYVEAGVARCRRLGVDPTCDPEILESAWQALETRSGPADYANRRLIGIALGESLWRQILAATETLQDIAQTPGARWIACLAQKARYARGYHGRVRLAGRTLDAWFGDEPFDTDAFLSALASSEWVDQSNPVHSRLLRLLDFDGPMFGIFSAEEKLSLVAWIQSLGESPDPLRAAGAARRHSGGTAQAAAGGPVPGAANAEAPLGNRDLYHGLLNIERGPDLLPAARAHAAASLKAARPRFGRVPFHYTADRFSAWLDAQYHRQLRGAGKQRARPLLSREVYRYAIEQLAPAVLIDGCWLQRIEQLVPDSPEVARNLRAIYSDELGAGVIEQNHPRVYRRLLENLGIELPPVASAEFAHHAGFLDASFDLPVFMLAISLSPHRFLPELLGLNLAIELSGLGAGYSRVAWELDYWGIDSRIVRLHQSIDNLAGGHAALARDCVRLHLEQVRALGGEPAVQQHWLRVWTGYRSLEMTSRSFRWQLGLRFGLDAAGVLLNRWSFCSRMPNTAHS